MKLTSIPQLARNANRVREIGYVLSKYGLADWSSRLGLGFVGRAFRAPGGDRLSELTHDARIRLALTELGTTFIKIGQILSTRPDLIGPALAQELTRLQADTLADPPDVVRATVESELKKPIKELFLEFDDEPLASASIGQVHRARLRNGQQVVVKVQHRGIESRIHNDLEILLGAAELAEQHLPEVKNYRPRATAAEFQRILLRELDFTREQRHLEEFARNFRGDASVRFPRAFPELCTRRVLTMELLDGVKLSQTQQLRELGYSLDELARRGASVFLDMVFRDGFYHADPHPGNILVLDQGVIGLLDCGMAGRIDERLRDDLEEGLMAVANRDAEHLTFLIMRVGAMPPELDEASLSIEVNDFLADYSSQPVEQLDIGQALRDITEIIRRHHIILPNGIALLIKLLLMLDGTARLLNPKFSLSELMQPYYQRLFWRRLSPTRQWQRLRRLYQEWEFVGKVLPRGLVGLVQQLKSGRFNVHLEHKRLEPSVNRLAFGILTSALFLGSALMWAHQVPPLLGDVSIVGAIGVGISSVSAIRLLWAIRKSGHLDKGV